MRRSARCNRSLARLGGVEVADEERRGKRERVHVLGRGGVDEAGLGKRRAGGLRLARRVHHRHAHQPEQLLHLLGLLARCADGPLLLPLDVLGGAALLLQARELRFRRLLPLLPLRQLARLERRRLAVEDEDGLDPRLHHADRAVEHAGEVRGDLARLVRELALAALLAHRDQKLVDLHARVDRDLPPERARERGGARGSGRGRAAGENGPAPGEVLHLVLPDAARRVVVEQLGEAVDAHVCV